MTKLNNNLEYKGYQNKLVQLISIPLIESN